MIHIYKKRTLSEDNVVNCYFVKYLFADIVYNVLYLKELFKSD